MNQRKFCLFIIIAHENVFHKLYEFFFIAFMQD